MKITSIKLAWLVLFSFFGSAAIGQYNWKLSKDEDGIKVYLSEVKHSKFKNIKVECTLEGTYDKLMAVLNDVNNQKSWVYNNISSSILKRISTNEFYYYTKTHLPWPMTNRDAVIHLKMNKDSLNRFLKVSSVSVEGYVPEKSDLSKGTAVKYKLVCYYADSKNNQHSLYFRCRAGWKSSCMGGKYVYRKRAL
jgi:hypothetical protein